MGGHPDTFFRARRSHGRPHAYLCRYGRMQEEKIPASGYEPRLQPVRARGRALIRGAQHLDVVAEGQSNDRRTTRRCRWPWARAFSPACPMRIERSSREVHSAFSTASPCASSIVWLLYAWPTRQRNRRTSPHEPRAGCRCIQDRSAPTRRRWEGRWLRVPACSRRLRTSRRALQPGAGVGRGHAGRDGRAGQGDPRP